MVLTRSLSHQSMYLFVYSMVGGDDFCMLSDDFFFVQAEDGIRDLVRSRGLGDVYKRQDPPLAVNDSTNTLEDVSVTIKVLANDLDVEGTPSVSYTHLTLPTSDLV